MRMNKILETDRHFSIIPLKTERNEVSNLFKIVDLDKNFEDSPWRRVCRFTGVHIPARFEKGLEHGWTINHGSHLIHRGRVQHNLRHSRLRRCQDFDGRGGVARRRWKNCLIVFLGKCLDIKMATCRSASDSRLNIEEKERH